MTMFFLALENTHRLLRVCPCPLQACNVGVKGGIQAISCPLLSCMASGMQLNLVPRFPQLQSGEDYVLPLL